MSSRTPSLKFRSNLAFALKSLLDKEVKLKIRLARSYFQGTLKAFDQYSNITIGNATLLEQDPESGELKAIQKFKQVIIRGDSIINIAQIENETN